MRNWKIWNNGTRIPEIYGTLVFLGLLLYFFVSYFTGWIHIIELRLLNLLFLFLGVYFALKQYRRTHRGNIDYFHAFTTGMATSAIGALAFSVFLLVYLSLNNNLMQLIAVNQPLGFYLDPYIASFMVLLEGIFSGLFVTFLLSNYLATRNPVTRVGGNSEIIQ